MGSSEASQLKFSPSIRQKTLAALLRLHFALDLGRTLSTKSFPLSLPKLVKLLSTEADPGVSFQLLRLIKTLLSVSCRIILAADRQERVHQIQSEDERLYLIEAAIGQGKRPDTGSQVKLAVLKTLQELVHGASRHSA